ncbi:polyprenyl synthetase family protein [Paenibacillaceae bacterium]|nr:polyprenyl synthetase family protein [Paenibacillaceae bacterium]
MARHIKVIEQQLSEIVPASWDIPTRLREAMSYSLEAGGKRLRPLLVIAAAEAVKESAEAGKAALPVACAIELVHTYSLVHDDLPAMDDDDYRRGKPTNHKVYGEAMAILAGDGLLTHAFFCIARAAHDRLISAETAITIVGELSQFGGAAGMVAGQVADILGEQGTATLADLEYIHLHKTSDLIAFSLRAGGMIGGATNEQIEALDEFGHKIGLAFQIQDDILDLIGDEQKLGKKVNSDVEQDKVTYPYLLGMEESKAEVERLTAEAVDKLLTARLANPGQLLAIAEMLTRREN